MLRRRGRRTHVDDDRRGPERLRELFGDGFIDHYCTTREWEWRQFNDAVTDWELARYFEII